MTLQNLRLTASYQADNIEVVLSAEANICDYGVPGSPVWAEPTNIQIEKFEIFGRDLAVEGLPEAIKAGVKENLVPELEWEPADL